MINSEEDYNTDDVPFYADWAHDINRMHDHYGVHSVMRNLDPDKLRAFLDFRADFLEEELTELRVAIMEGNSEEIVDACIDLCVVAIGTLDAFDVNAQKAWLEVLRANMAKKVGIKEGRPNPLGLPDLIKPEGWTPPSHELNHGFLPIAFQTI